MLNVIIIADCREDFPSTIKNKKYNDHYSLKSIHDIQSAIRSLGYSCEHIGGVNSLIDLLYKKKFPLNTLFLNFSDGLTQKNRRMQVPLLLELLDAKYSGSDPFGVGVANDKYFCCKFLKENGINVPNAFLYKDKDDFNNLNIKYPLIVKPNGEGSSLGINQHSICHNEKDVIAVAETLKNQNYISLIEEYIPGYEVTNFLIGNHNHFLLNELILSKYNNTQYFDNFVFGQEEKTSGQRQQMILTTENSPFPIKKIKNQSMKIFRLLGLHDIARVDYRISQDGIPTFIEVNSLPVFSKSSEVGAICHFYNKSFSDILELLINTTKERLKML